MDSAPTFTVAKGCPSYLTHDSRAYYFDKKIRATLFLASLLNLAFVEPHTLLECRAGTTMHLKAGAVADLVWRIQNESPSAQ